MALCAFGSVHMKAGVGDGFKETKRCNKFLSRPSCRTNLKMCHAKGFLVF